MNYVWLVPTMSKSASGLSAMYEFDVDAFDSGEPVESLTDAYFEVDRDLNKRYGPKQFCGDLLANEDDLWVVSQRLKDFFVAEKIPEVHFVPVDIFEGRKKHDGYYVMQFLTGIDGIDEKETTISYGFGGIAYVDNLTLDPESIGDERLFKITDMPQPVFATVEFANRLKDLGFESFEIRPTQEFGQMTYD